jgi:hypothetical protein
MSAVLLAIFNDYALADRVRTVLVQDGFPTDRVELTATCDPGRAALEPAKSQHAQFVQYFRCLLTHADETDFPERFAERVDNGAAAITVHPRGPVETQRATQILAHASPVETVRHDLDARTWEHAAARHESPWLSHFWVENKGDYHCIYCRLFESDTFEGNRPLPHDHTP